MKTISRKALRETIQSKGIEASLRIGKSGLTAKQKKFAEGLVLEGLTASDSYRRAYDTKGKSSTVNPEASRLSNSPKIAATIEALERAKQASASHSAESLKALVVSTLVDVATNSDRDAVRVAAVKTLGTVVGVDMFRETKRIETVKDSDEIKNQIMQQLKTMMLSTGDAVEVDANDLLSELVSSEPTHAPPTESENGTPADHVHTIPHEPSDDLSEDPPISEQTEHPQGDIFLENKDS